MERHAIYRAMRTAFHEALETARLTVIQLGALCLDSVRASSRALERRDVPLAARVIAGDDQIKEMRRRVDAACVEMIWKQQPVAGELRAIAGMLQIVSDLERIGDYAAENAKFAVRLSDMPERPGSIQIERISALAQSMLADAMRAYRDEEPSVADAVIARDDEVDDVYQSCIQALESEMRVEPSVVSPATILLFVLANIERVGDRAQNIAWKTKDVYAP
ncbi:MAG TPA: phosphate signaling complex protein PhoU [Candidatus Elarobacter sp.]|jgi:phosphate transport system protein|nr:phosphate signaling complex protein PhoU [Candidatus Elarobacter sp.]